MKRVVSNWACLLLALSGLGAACTRCAAPSLPDASQSVAVEVDAGVAPPLEEEIAYVTGTSTVYRSPPEGGRGGARMRLATLYRGDEVAALRHETDWREVRLADGGLGWLQKDRLTFPTVVRRATVVRDEVPFDQPPSDVPVKRRSRRTIPAGTVLFAPTWTRVRVPGWTELNVVRGVPLWLRDEEVVTDPRELAAARQVTRARALARRGDEDGARAAWKELFTSFADSALVRHLQPDDGGEADSGRPASPEPEDGGTVSGPAAAPDDVALTIGGCRWALGGAVRLRLAGNGPQLEEGGSGPLPYFADWTMLAAVPLGDLCGKGYCRWACTDRGLPIANRLEPDEALPASPQLVEAAGKAFERSRRRFAAGKKDLELDAEQPGWLVLADGTLVTAAQWTEHFNLPMDERGQGSAGGLLVVAVKGSRSAEAVLVLESDR